MQAKSPQVMFWLNLSLLAMLICPGNLSAAAQAERKASAMDSAMGRLVIEGKAIECLVLEKRYTGHQPDATAPLRLDQPGRSVAIPAGEYRVQEIHLRGGYRCFPPRRVGDSFTDEVREVGWFTVDTDAPYVLRVGAPLKPVLEFVRENRTLRTVYHLYDTSGEKSWQYFPPDYRRGTVAALSIYREGRRVGSGNLVADSYG